LTSSTTAAHAQPTLTPPAAAVHRRLTFSEITPGRTLRDLHSPANPLSNRHRASIIMGKRPVTGLCRDVKLDRAWRLVRED
jgi:hypothetical protein